MPPETCPHKLDVEVAVVKQRQNELDRRHDTFMASIDKSIDEMNRHMSKVWDEVNSVHGHLTRCRDELRDEIERDFMTKTEGEEMRGSIKQINTKLYMTGAGIVLALSFVQIAIAVFT